MIQLLSKVQSQFTAPTPPPTRVEPDKKTTYDRGKQKKEPEQKAMRISLDSYEED